MTDKGSKCTVWGCIRFSGVEKGDSPASSRGPGGYWRGPEGHDLGQFRNRTRTALMGSVGKNGTHRGRADKETWKVGLAVVPEKVRS